MNFEFSRKRIFLIGFALLLLIGIPVTIYLVQKQQEVRSHAEKSTNLTFSPTSSATAPIQKNVGDSIPLDIMVDPGKNLVSFVKLEIQYDPDKLATTGATTFQANTVAFPSVLEGPIYAPGKISVTLSVGPDPTKAIQSAVKAATITLKALANTPPGTPTLVTYGATTQVLSIGSNDQASENVLASEAPATIVIGGSAPSGNPSNTPSSKPSEGIPTGTPTPTIAIPSSTPTATEKPTATIAPSSIPTNTPTPTIPISPAPTGTGGGGGTNQIPVCNSLVVDRATTGTAPYAITFTANGTDSDGTISKVTFNFGDGQVSDVTQAGGIGTNTVNVQLSHTYENTGTFQASAILTDNSDGISTATTSCKQTITVTAAGVSASPAAGTPTPTIAATGPTTVIYGAGALFLLVIGGGLLFFLL